MDLRDVPNTLGARDRDRDWLSPPSPQPTCFPGASAPLPEDCALTGSDLRCGGGGHRALGKCWNGQEDSKGKSGPGWPAESGKGAAPIGTRQGSMLSVPGQQRGGSCCGPVAWETRISEPLPASLGTHSGGGGKGAPLDVARGWRTGVRAAVYWCPLVAAFVAASQHACPPRWVWGKISGQRGQILGGAGLLCHPRLGKEGGKGRCLITFH